MTTVADTVLGQCDLAKYNGELTVTSNKTGEHRTYLIKTIETKEGKSARMVGMLSGPDNRNDYVFFGFVNVSQEGKAWVYVFKNKLGKYIEHGKMLGNIESLLEQGKVEVAFSVKCRKCNRLLTDPTSIDLGIGPVCRGD